MHRCSRFVRPSRPQSRRYQSTEGCVTPFEQLVPGRCASPNATNCNHQPYPKADDLAQERFGGLKPCSLTTWALAGEHLSELESENKEAGARTLERLAAALELTLSEFLRFYNGLDPRCGAGNSPPDALFSDSGAKPQIYVWGISE